MIGRQQSLAELSPAIRLGDIQNSGHAPTAASESAIIADLQPGIYIAPVRGVNNSNGVALVEVSRSQPRHEFKSG